MERQKRRASSSDDNDDDDDEEDSEEHDEDLAALQSIPDVSLGSDDGADSPVGAMTEESFARKRVASSPIREPSPKRPCATTAGGQDSSRVAPVASSPLGPEALT